MKIDKKKIRVITPDENLEYFDDIFKFCQKAHRETKLKQTIKNMSPVNWEENKESLLYRIYVKGFFDNEKGMLTLVYYNNELISLSGVESYSNDVAIMAKRYFVLRAYRPYPFLHNFMLDPQLEWALKRKFKVALLTINEYQKNTVFSLIKRSKENKAFILGKKIKMPKYKDFTIHPEIVKLNNSFQYILYKDLEESCSWSPDEL